MRFNERDLERYLKQQQEKGKIVGYRLTNSKSGRKKLLRKKGKQHYWIELNLQYWCNEKALELTREYQFHPYRKFRFDWAIPALKVGIEYEGLMAEKSRHTTVTGYSVDAQKYNLAQSEGWKVLRYTALNYKNAIEDLNKMLCQIK